MNLIFGNIRISCFGPLPLLLFLFLTGCGSQMESRNDSINDNASINGKTIASVMGSFLDSVLTEKYPDCKIQYYNSITDGVAALEAGHVDAFTYDEPVARLIVKRKQQLKIIYPPYYDDQYGFVFSKSQSELAAQFTAELEKMKSGGELKKMEAIWFGDDESLKTVEYPAVAPRGVLRVAVVAQMEPFAYIKDQKIVGYETDIMCRIFKRLGYGVEYVPVEFNGFLPSIVSNRTAMGHSSISITEERKKSVLFSTPDYIGGAVLMVRSGAATGSQSFWTRLKQSFHSAFIVESRYLMIVRGLWNTFFLSICSITIGCLMGAGLCILRRSPHKLWSTAAKVYIRLFQGLPILVILMILYYIIFVQMPINALWIAAIGFSLSIAAYSCEIFRSGLDAVDRGQREAAIALGMSSFQTFWTVIAPQAATHSLPVLKGEIVSTVKMTSVVGFISVEDLTRAGDLIRSSSFDAFFPLILVAILYFFITWGFVAFLTAIEWNVDPRRQKERFQKQVQRYKTRQDRKGAVNHE